MIAGRYSLTAAWILTIAICFKWSLAISCTCDHPPTFCESMDSTAYPADIVVLGVKVADVYHGMKFKVLYDTDTIIPIGDTITVWGYYNGGDGACRVGTGLWAVGDTLFAGFHICDLLGSVFATPPNLEQPGSYRTNECGTFYMNYSAGEVLGPIAPGLTFASIADMAQYRSGCPNSMAVGDVDEQLQMSIVPTGNGHDIVLPDAYASSSPVMVFDMNGRLVGQIVVAAGAGHIPMQPPGCYAVVAALRGRRVVERFVQQ